MFLFVPSIQNNHVSTLKIHEHEKIWVPENIKYILHNSSEEELNAENISLRNT